LFSLERNHYDDRMEWGKLIRDRYMALQGLTQRQVAQATGLSTGRVNELLSGGGAPKRETAEQILDLLQVPDGERALLLDLAAVQHVPAEWRERLRDLIRLGQCGDVDGQAARLRDLADANEAMASELACLRARVKAALGCDAYDARRVADIGDG